MHALKEDLETNADLDSQRATLKKIPNWKTPDHDGIYGFWVG